MHIFSGVEIKTGDERNEKDQQVDGGAVPAHPSELFETRCQPDTNMLRYLTQAN